MAMRIKYPDGSPAILAAWHPKFNPHGYLPYRRKHFMGVSPKWRIFAIIGWVGWTFQYLAQWIY